MLWYVPKNVHTLILGTCEYVTLLGKRDFAGVIKIKGLGMGSVFLDEPGGPNLITGVFKSREPFLPAES